jgi:short-subunit dehydrogenase
MSSTLEPPYSGRPLALVTGASVGIGQALAWELGKHGYDLVLTARDRARLDAVGDEIAGTHDVATRSVDLDLATPGASATLFERLGDAADRLDVLVNNAGFGTFGPFVDTSANDTGAMIRLNVEALTHLTRLALPGMIARGAGRILNVASTAAFQPGPRMAVYYATKAYVLSFSEAVFEELRGTGVTVTTLCPGITRTEFHARADMEDSGLLARGKRVVTPGLANRLGTVAARLVPRGFSARVVSRLQASRDRPGK